MDTKNFLDYLQRKFPCADLETVAPPSVFAGDFEATPEFWQGIGKALKPYSQDEALRCVDIIDYVGRCVNRRYGEVTLSHCKNLEFTRLMLEYLKLSLFWREDITCLHVLLFLDIEFELKNGIDIPVTEKSELLHKCAVVHHLLDGYTMYYLGRIYVLDPEKEEEYAKAYSYLYCREEKFVKLFKDKGLID